MSNATHIEDLQLSLDMKFNANTLTYTHALNHTNWILITTYPTVTQGLNSRQGFTQKKKNDSDCVDLHFVPV